MAKMTVEFEYDEHKLGAYWFNEDNLKLCLFGESHTKPELLTVTETGHFIEEIERPVCVDGD